MTHTFFLEREYMNKGIVVSIKGLSLDDLRSLNIAIDEWKNTSPKLDVLPRDPVKGIMLYIYIYSNENGGRCVIVAPDVSTADEIRRERAKEGDWELECEEPICDGNFFYLETC